jgi:DNA-binding LacI/PurR family transcriptional regulator
MRGCLTVAASSDEDPARERQLAAALTARRIDGLVVVPASDDSSYLRPERQPAVPLAFVDRPPRFLDADTVLSDNAGGAGTATRHLIERGHRRIGFLGDHARVYTCAERLRGYQAALSAGPATVGAGTDPDLVRLDLDQDTVFAAVPNLLDRPDLPTALLASQNLLTIGAIRAARARPAPRRRPGRLRRRTAGRHARTECHRRRAAPGRPRPGGHRTAVQPHRRVGRTEPSDHRGDRLRGARLVPATRAGAVS